MPLPLKPPGEVQTSHEKKRFDFKLPNYNTWLKENFRPGKRMEFGHYCEEVVHALLKHRGWDIERVDDKTDTEENLDYKITVFGKKDVEKVDLKAAKGRKPYLDFVKNDLGDNVKILGIPGEDIKSAARGEIEAQNYVEDLFTETVNAQIPT